MSLLAVTENWSDGNTLTAAMLAAAMTSIETWANGNIDSTNIATGGVAEANIASSAVTETKIGSGAVTTAKLGDLAVTTGKIAANAVTRAKLESVGQQLSSTSGSDSISGTGAFEDITNLSVSLTTTGRPVFLALIADGTTNPASIQLRNAGGPVSAYVSFFRGATEIGRIFIRIHEAAAQGIYYPVTPVHIDAPAAGTYTYKARAQNDGDPDNLVINNYKLVGYEL
jgi:hypothetical protein